MANRRKTDAPIGRSQFRSDRIVQDGGKWYFHTREGSIEGPFDCRVDAIHQLEVYVRLAENDLLKKAYTFAMQA